MNRILFIALIATSSMFAQVKNVGDFDEVKVFDRINVELVPSGENKVELSGSRTGDVEVVNNNGQLKLRMKLTKLLDGENVKARVHYKALESVDASEGAIISGTVVMVQEDIEITAKEGAIIELGLDVQEAEVKSVTGGIVRLNGKAGKLEASLGTGGILQAKGLVTTRTEVSINAGGEADVNATDLVDATVRAGGTIKIFGKPKQINKKTTLGGTIEESK